MLPRFAPLQAVPRLRAYTVGLLRAMAHRSTDILPVEADVSAYDCIIVAGPVWGGNPAPALYDFIREYDLAGRQTYGLLTCAKEGKRAAKVLRGELGKNRGYLPFGYFGAYGGANAGGVEKPTDVVCL